MPAYSWLDRPLKDAAIQTKMQRLNLVSHGYSEAEIAAAPSELEGKTELDAIVAYLQVLGIHAPKN
jgi:cytochrome c oxidase cbb3-type subunit 2